MYKAALAFAMFCALSISAQEKVQPLDVKLGLWEVTHTNSMTGQMPIPPEALAKLTPEQRARFEAMMKAREDHAPKTTTERNCVTAEKLQKFSAFNDRKECTNHVINSSSKKMEVKMTCANGDIKTDANVLVEALSSESVRGSVQAKSEGGGHAINVNNTFTAKWISANCGEVKQ